jgi:hypothetical protein
MASLGTASKRVRTLGDFFAMSLDAVMLPHQRPFVWRELLFQTRLVARVTIVLSAASTATLEVERARMQRRAIKVERPGRPAVFGSAGGSPPVGCIDGPWLGGRA